MFIVADTDKLTTDKVITQDQAQEMKTRARETMVMLAINAILCVGILSATGGLIFWLASPLAVAICGMLFLASGLLILTRASDLFRMFGNAAALIGSGMMIGGAALELVDKYDDIAGPTMLVAGLVIAAIAGYRFKTRALTTQFVTGAIFLMGSVSHLTGVYFLVNELRIDGITISLIHVYAALAIAFTGWFVNIRTITALAIFPFAQALNTGTFYWHAVYAFYSPEPTLSILQMTALMLAALWIGNSSSEPTKRHTGILSIMAFIVANLCALVGSLFGDRIGETMWGPGTQFYRSGFEDKDTWTSAREVFLENVWTISDEMYAILWALALLAMIIFAAHKNYRGLFNTAITFACIHAYTQMFENFGQYPLAWVIGGLAAIPLAWGLWQLNKWLAARSEGSKSRVIA